MVQNVQPYFPNQIPNTYNQNLSYLNRFDNGCRQNREKSIISVNGIEGAYMFQMAPNDKIALFDSNEDICYIKTTDDAGFASIDTYDIVKRVSKTDVETTGEYVTRKEFDELKQVMDDVKQYIWRESRTDSNDKSDITTSATGEKTASRTKSR